MTATYLQASPFAAALAMTRMSDRELSVLFGVNQSTISRLRHGKIQKTRRYEEILHASGFRQVMGTRELDVALDGLARLARQAPELAHLLCILHRIMQERARDGFPDHPGRDG